MVYQNDRINNLKRLEANRKKLRNNATSAEEMLWIFLKKRRLAGRKFRRQFSVQNYILYFYCVDEKLAIELDGQHHYTKQGKILDAERDAFLREQGIRVLRFENKKVFENLKEVLEEIEKSFLPLRPSDTSPARGGKQNFLPLPGGDVTQ